MPPTTPGDPGSGPGDEGEFRPPLPPEDRIWRHPSEVAALGASDASPGARTAAAVRRRTLPRRGVLAVAAVSALIGATGSAGLLALAGRLDADTLVVERERAVQPVASTEDPDAALTALTARTAPSVARLTVDRSGETTEANAIVFRSDGYLLTAARMVDGADRIAVTIDGRSADASVVGVDSVTDIALLHVDLDDLDPADLGSSDRLAPGDEMFAIGITQSEAGEAVVSAGLLSAVGTRTTIPDGTAMHGMLLVDGTLRRGTAGCALVDRSGAVVGVATMAAADDAHAAAVPIDTARAVGEQLMTAGHAVHPWIGVSGSDLGADIAESLGIDGGAAIAQVMTDGPAHGAGMQAGDVVTHVDGEPIGSMTELVGALRTRQPGDEVVVGMRRDGADAETIVVVGQRPPDDD